MPAPHHSIFYRQDALSAAQPTRVVPKVSGLIYKETQQNNGD